MQNKYSNTYIKIILKARSRIPVDGEYYEKHHIIPKALKGTKVKENLVKLTPKEHYICHHLLTKFTLGEDKKKMVRAWNLMSHRPSKGNFVPAVIYSFLREQLKSIGTKGESNYQYRKDVPTPILQKEYLDGFSASTIARKHSLNKSTVLRRLYKSGTVLRDSEETKNNGKNHKGGKPKDWIPSEEQRENYSKAAKNRYQTQKHPRLGKSHTKETREKMREYFTGRPNPKNSVIQKALIEKNGSERQREIGKKGAASRWDKVVE